MSKIYAIKLNNGSLHKNNLGEIVYFSNKNNVRAYMKYNHYDGIIQPLIIDLKKDEKIADLETKLEQLQKERELDNSFWKQECDSLQKALAEKEKEIKKLKEVVDCVDKLKQFNADMKDYALVNKDVADEIYCERQTKTDFAIEQLKQTKKLIEKKYTYDVEESDWAVVYELDIDEIFEQQINKIYKGDDEK